MNVYLIGKTEVNLFPPRGNSRHVMPGKAEGSEFEKRVRFNTVDEDGQHLIEFAGRLCYESFDLPNPHTKTNSNYVKSIVALGHESVLEHVSVTFYVEGVSRTLSHELIRHRHLSFSEVSQRYVNVEDYSIITPPTWREIEEGVGDKIPLPDATRDTYKHNVQAAIDRDYSRKEAREAARMSLPAGLETKLVVSGNLRAWRDVLKKRWTSHADREMRDFAGEVLNHLLAEYPDVFQDIEYE